MTGPRTVTTLPRFVQWSTIPSITVKPHILIIMFIGQSA